MPGGKIAKIRLLGSDALIKWTQSGDGLAIRLPKGKPCKHAFVLRIDP